MTVTEAVDRVLAAAMADPTTTLDRYAQLKGAQLDARRIDALINPPPPARPAPAVHGGGVQLLG